MGDNEGLFKIMLLLAAGGLISLLNGGCAKPAKMLHDFTPKDAQTVENEIFHEPICLSQGNCGTPEDYSRPWFYATDNSLILDCSATESVRPEVGCNIGISLHPFSEATRAHNLETGSIELSDEGYPVQRINGVYINTKLRFEDFRNRHYSSKNQKVIRLTDGRKIFVDTVQLKGIRYIPVETKSRRGRTNTVLIPLRGAVAYECPESGRAELPEDNVVRGEKGEIIIANYDTGVYSGVKQ